MKETNMLRKKVCCQNKVWYKTNMNNFSNSQSLLQPMVSKKEKRQKKLSRSRGLEFHRVTKINALLSLRISTAKT